METGRENLCLCTSGGIHEKKLVYLEMTYSTLQPDAHTIGKSKIGGKNFKINVSSAQVRMQGKNSNHENMWSRWSVC